jgi:hypothetical protein
MRDSTNAAHIPIAGTDIACGYINGSSVPPTWDAVLARFPGIPKVAIDVFGNAPGAQARDWETGDKGGDLEQWVKDHNQLSGAKDAVIYCNRDTIAEVRRLTGSQVLNRDYYLWVATLDGTIYGPDQLAGVIACQDKGSQQTGHDYDESVVWPNAAIWWSDGVISNPPQPRPAPKPLYGAPRNLAVQPGDTTVRVTRCDPPAGSIGSPDHYEISVFTGSYPSPATLVASYPRFMRAAPQQFGGLQGIASGTHMTLRAVAVDAAGTAGAYADVHFEMP